MMSKEVCPVSRARANLLDQRGVDETPERPRRGEWVSQFDVSSFTMRNGSGGAGVRGARSAPDPAPSPLLLVVNTFTTDRSVEKVIY